MIQGEMKVECAHDGLVEIDSLVPNPRNANEHPDAQIKLLAKIMKHQGWRNPIVVSNRSGFMTKGHGRLMAAKLNGWVTAPVDYQDYRNEADEWADMIADNKIAELAESNEMRIQEIAMDLGPDFDFDLFGIPDFKLSDSDGSLSSEELDLYTKKIKAPVYEPKGEKPAIKDLYDPAKSRALLEKIEAAKIPEEEKEFLRNAAYRHIVFDYENIAEFYSHATPETQELMESSALVIIDFGKAIENGFVVLSQEIAEAYLGGE